MPRPPKRPKPPTVRELHHAVVNRRNAAMVAMEIANKGNGDAALWAAIAAAEWAAAVDLQVEEILRLVRRRRR